LARPLPPRRHPEEVQPIPFAASELHQRHKIGVAERFQLLFGSVSGKDWEISRVDEIGLLIQTQVVEVTRLYHALCLCWFVTVCHVSVFHETFYETLHETSVASFFVVIPACIENGDHPSSAKVRIQEIMAQPSAEHQQLIYFGIL
jgi:hypothetical protein